MNKPFSTDRAARRRAWLAGLGVVVAAFACRWFWTAQERAVRWDEPDYLILARNLLRGAGYQVFGKPELIWPPGAPILAASSMLAGVAADQALAAWHVIAGAALAGLVYGLSREVTGDARVAVLAGLLTALSPALVVWPLYWGSNTESAFTALIVAGLWASWRMLRQGRWRARLSRWPGLWPGIPHPTRRIDLVGAVSADWPGHLHAPQKRLARLASLQLFLSWSPCLT